LKKSKRIIAATKYYFFRFVPKPAILLPGSVRNFLWNKSNIVWFL